LYKPVHFTGILHIVRYVSQLFDLTKTPFHQFHQLAPDDRAMRPILEDVAKVKIEIAPPQKLNSSYYGLEQANSMPLCTSFYEMTAAGFAGVQVPSFNGEGFQDRLADFDGFNFATNHEAGFVSSS
jgi:hypothetical protein